jgi:hypothetical protein
LTVSGSRAGNGRHSSAISTATGISGRPSTPISALGVAVRAAGSGASGSASARGAVPWTSGRRP